MSLEPGTVGVRARSVNENKTKSNPRERSQDKRARGWVCEQKDSMTEKEGVEGEKNKTFAKARHSIPISRMHACSLFTPHSLRMGLLSILL